MSELPITINNWYSCTVPQLLKPHKPEISKRIHLALGRLSADLQPLVPC